MRIQKSYVLVFRTDDQIKFDLIKGFLRTQGIPFVTTGDATAPFGTAIQKNALDTNWESRGCQLFVPPGHAAEAQSLLRRVGK